MRTKRFYIPIYQPLSPEAFLSSKNGKREFPFSWERSRYYYYARNGIWHAVDILGLKPGDEVLMPSYHHGVEVEVLLRRGLKLKYYRVNKKMQIDINHLESLVSPRTRLLYIVYYLGFPQPITELRSLATRYNLLLFEDCALSLFSRIPDGPLGSFGDASIFCLYKTLPLPHGAMLLLNRSELSLPPLADVPDKSSIVGNIVLSLLRFLSIKGGRWGGIINSTFKSTGVSIKQAIGLKRIPIDTNLLNETLINLGVSPFMHYLIDRQDVEKIIGKRRENFLYMAKSLQHMVEFPFDELPEGVCPLFFPIFVKNKVKVQTLLLEEGIETINFWSLYHPDMPADKFPDVDFLRKHVLEVPIHQGLNMEHLDYIAANLKKSIK